ncbi:hypothetical protein [Shewanella frigidimarina]|uniref:hypothetical protein n=1 Tax=Shewanella frigidimarina TaxID=56812 RepID=UPI0013652D49|nr:hypothetical protein [Shewanella frigidimarina]
MYRLRAHYFAAFPCKHHALTLKRMLSAAKSLLGFVEGINEIYLEFGSFGTGKPF